MFILVLWFIIVSVITLLYLISSKDYNYWKKRNVDYIKPLPFFGCMWPNISLKLTSGELFQNLYNKIDSDFFGIFVFHRPILVIKSPQLIKNILLRDFDNFPDRTAKMTDKHKVATNVMFFKYGPGWKNIRSKMTPVFTSGKLRAMFKVVLKESDLMLDYINLNFIKASNSEAKEICAKYATNVIARCAFGVEANSFKNENAEFRNFGRSLFDFRLDTVIRQGVCFFLPAVTSLFNISFFDTKILDKMISIFNEVLQQRMKMNTLKGVDMIDILIEHSRNNDDEEFSSDVAMAQAFQFFVAGFETVSASISFGLYELALHPDIQNKLRKEIQDSVKDHGGLKYDGIMNLKYLDMVLSETLRKYPVLPFLDRLCIDDYKIPGTDVVIEKGTGVYIPLLALHHDPKYFPNPQKFIPERFADKSKINENGFYYLPFGEGPRHCIGMRFGIVTSNIGLAQILFNYQLLRSEQTPDFIDLEPKAILVQSKVGIPIKFEKI